MASQSKSRLFVLLISTACVCSGQTDRIAATGWAHFYANQYAVPSELVEAIIEAESAWQPNAVSPKGAVGLMQLMPVPLDVGATKALCISTDSHLRLNAATRHSSFGRSRANGASAKPRSETYVCTVSRGGPEWS